MLVIDRFKTVRNADDRGAALISVVIVMLVGFIIASVVAASIMFTTRASPRTVQTSWPVCRS